MIMSPQQKEKVEITWKALAIALCAYIGYELREIKYEIRQSSDFRIEQRGINREMEKMLNDIKAQKSELATEVKELKTYYWETIGRRKQN